MTNNIELKFQKNTLHDRYHCFLLADGFPVSYVAFYLDENKDIQLMDIETREGFRNYGYATMILEELSRQNNNRPVHHNGSFTDDGYHYIKNKLLRNEYENPAKISYRAMTFVHNWDEMQPKYF